MTLWILLFLVSSSATAESTKSFTELADIYDGPVAIDFLTASTVVVSERTSLSLVELETGVKTELVGSATMGGYVDGEREQVRFSLINDVVVQGNYMYIADYSCVRIYDIERKCVATLAGICGRMEDSELIASTVSPAFKGHLKLAVSARDLYVLDGDKISRVDRETGVVWTLSVSQKLSEGYATSIDIDKYSNTLFVAVATPLGVNVISVDIASGKQSLYREIRISSSVIDRDITAMVASLDVAPNGTIFVLEPHGLHSIDRDNEDITSEVLENFGYHEIVVSSRYLVITQEFYSRMYKIHLMNMAENPKVTNGTGNVARVMTGDETKDSRSASIQVFESQTFYLAIIFPSILFLLVIIVVIFATRKIIRNKADRRNVRPASDSSSEKYFLNQEGNPYDASYWM